MRREIKNMTLKSPVVDFETMIVNADNAVTTLTPEDVDARRMKPGTLVVDIRYS